MVVSLGWNPVSGASVYNLLRAEGSETGTYLTIYEGDGSDVAIDDCTVSNGAPNCNSLVDWLVYTESDLTIDSVYYYRLDSCGDLGCVPSDILQLSVSPPQPWRVDDAPPEKTPELDALVADLAPGPLAALVQWEALLTTKAVSGRYTVILSVSVDSEGVTTTLYDEYDATLTLTNALPYKYRLSRSVAKRRRIQRSV